MDRPTLLAGYQYANRRFYSRRSISKRLSRSPVQLAWTLPLNIAYALALPDDRVIPAREKPFSQQAFPAPLESAREITVKSNGNALVFEGPGGSYTNRSLPD
jgi:hypothetical protein